MSDLGDNAGGSGGSGSRSTDAQFVYLVEENRSLREELGSVHSALALALEQLALSEASVEALKRRLELDSSTSSKPPSSDGLKKPRAPRRTQSLREKTDRKPGGQPDHEGKTLRRSEHVDRVEDHVPSVCKGCGASLSGSVAVGFGEGEPVLRQVFDLPEPQPLMVTEHRGHACLCGHCGVVTRASFPSGVSGPVQYGPRISSMAVWLRHGQFLPERRVGEVLEVLCGARVSSGTLGAMSRRAAARLRPVAERIEVLASVGARVKHLDETGLRVAGGLQWLHVISTPLLSSYRVTARRGAVPEGVSGVVVHDHWQCYWPMPGVEHALCNAHHRRELEAVARIDKEAWAERLQKLLRMAHRARRRGFAVAARWRGVLERFYDRIVAGALAFHESLPPLPRKTRAGAKQTGTEQTGGRPRAPPGVPKRRKGHNLALRLCRYRDEALRFMAEPDVPFTNNEAERALRMMKLRQNISGCFRSQREAHNFAILRSVMATAAKQGRNVLDTLMASPERLIAEIQYA